MYKEVNKLAIACLTFSSLAVMTACGDSASQRLARSLYAQSEEALEQGRYEQALALTDSIKNSCPDQIEIRRRALHIASRATEGLTLKLLEQADSLLAATAVAGDSLSRLVKKVDNPIEPYFVTATVDPASIKGVTGIQARMSPDGHFYIMSSLTGRRVNSTSVSVSDGVSSAATTPVAHDGERNDRSMGAEVITFMGVECDSLGHFVSLNRDRKLTLTFHGSSDYSVPLTAAQAEAIATLWDYSVTLRKAKVASLEKERLSRALELARSHAARTFVENSDEAE